MVSLINCFEDLEELTRLILRSIFRFSGDPLPDETINRSSPKEAALEPQQINQPNGQTTLSSAVIWLAKPPSPLVTCRASCQLAILNRSLRAQRRLYGCTQPHSTASNLSPC